MDSPEATIVIPARNAAPTIERAVRSAVQQNPSRILLIDHGCTDGTIPIARRAGDERLQVVRADSGASLGEVRRVGLQAVETAFGMWLDADDELKAGRLARLVNRLESDGTALAFDEVDLYDGPTGAFLRRLSIPPFLSPRTLPYTFARNYLPGIGVPAFRAGAARDISFDPDLHGAEDFDFLLRAIVAGVPISLVRDSGYRQFAYPATVSRNAGNQRRMSEAALRKHDPLAVEALFERSGLPPRQIAWAMVSFHIFRGDLGAAESWLQRAGQYIEDPAEILEPDGPEPVGEGWRHDFYRGTLAAAAGRTAEAVPFLERAVAARRAPEALNNLAVVLRSIGRSRASRDLLIEAARTFPSYADALANLETPSASRFTLHPLRRTAARTDYV
jgi:glycosyltransferase involved in cell wall biosynthesis